MNLVIPDTTYQFLRVQRGDVSHIEPRKQFEQAYRKALAMQFANIEPFLPSHVETVIDVGGGMSGIGVILKKIYGRYIRHYVVDGLLDDPVVDRHSKTFSNASALADFYTANDATPVFAVSPTENNLLPPGERTDLVTSFAAWGFHIPPEEYLDRVYDCVQIGTVLILDVRRDKPQWLYKLTEELGDSEVIERLPKLERRVWRF